VIAYPDSGQPMAAYGAMIPNDGGVK
jgi:hypothetical protein